MFGYWTGATFYYTLLLAKELRNEISFMVQKWSPWEQNHSQFFVCMVGKKKAWNAAFDSYWEFAQSDGKWLTQLEHSCKKLRQEVVFLNVVFT